ncbi:MAG: hypothetical protein ACLFR0_06800 [Alphaproteobacteria bacterium]
MNIDFNTNANWKRKTGLGAVMLAAAVGLSGCQDDAGVASHNVSKAADNFEINRQIVFYNGITDQYIAEIEGLCSIEADGADKQLEVTCKVGETSEGQALVNKHFLGLSDNVTYFVLQTEPSDVSLFHHRVTFKPQTIVPDIDYRASGEELLTPSPQQ